LFWFGPNSAIAREAAALSRIATNNLDNSASVLRMARIDELAGANYQRILSRDLSSTEYVYRGVSQEMVDIYKMQNAVSGRSGLPTYFSLDVGGTPSLHALGAQMPKAPEVMLRIPRAELVEPFVPRPLYGTASTGREYFANSYPSWGHGGYRQFMGTTKSFSENWILWGAR
jgi:hypothetical protein